MELLDRLRLEVPNADIGDGEANEDYVPGEYDDNDDDDDDNHGGGGEDIYPQQGPANVDENDDDNVSIILNLAGPEHDAPMAGLATDQDQTDTSGKETADITRDKEQDANAQQPTDDSSVADTNNTGMK